MYSLFTDHYPVSAIFCADELPEEIAFKLDEEEEKE